MTRCRTLVLGLLLLVVQSAIGQNFKSNPFLSNGYANDVNAFISDQERSNQIDMNANVFLNHAISNRAAGFSGPQYLPPKEKQQLICSGQDVCVRKNSCNNGYFTQKQQGGSRQDCDYDTEICCLYKPPPPPPTPVPSTPCTGNNYACVGPNLCQNGEIKTSNFLKSQSSGKCYAPEICCRIPEPESTVLDENGYHLKVPKNPLIVPTQKPYQPQPYQPTQKPYQQTPKPYQQTPAPYEPTQKPYQPKPQPQQPYQPTQKPYQQTPKPYQPQPQPQQPYQPTQKPYQPQPQPQQPYQPTQKPYQPQPQPQQPYQPTQKPYQPQPQPQQPYQPTQKPYQPQPQPQQPYQPTQKPYQPQPQPQQPYQPTQKPYQPKPQPQQPYQPTQKPYQPQPQPQQPYQPTQRPIGPRFPTTSAPQYLPPTKQPYQPKPTPPRRGEDQLSLPIPKPERPRPPIIGNDILGEPQLPQTCAAALNCTRTEYCSATGVIQETPVVLTPEQELFRVPMTKCQDQVQGFSGVCCRDSNYVDPWPVSQLGQYNAKDFGDDGTYKPNPGISRIQRRVGNVNTAKISRKSSVAAKVSRQATKQCVSRNSNSVLKGIAAIDADFGEYPWQTMVLLESTKSLLCGGIIVADDVVITAAHCVTGRKPFDVLVKAGEWKLGRDEEPLTFQISRAKKIEIHPQYNPSGLQYDIAILHLDSKLKFDTHIGPICIDDTEPTSSEQCITTGWGKEVLRVHAQDAIMHHSPVTVVSRDECGNADESKVCGKPDIDGCDLDPGSALACKNNQGQYVLKGVYSSEDKCGDSNISFTKPDSTWINSAIYNTGKLSSKIISSNSF